MNTAQNLKSVVAGFIATLACFILCSCEYDVPITAKPTQKVNENLLGSWTSKDGKDKMKVVKYDESHYIIYSNGDLFRAWQSDVAKTPFFTVQKLDSAGKYYYSVWKLADDGTLTGSLVNDKIVPDGTKDSAGVRDLLEKNISNPDLLQNPEQYTQDKEN